MLKIKIKKPKITARKAGALGARIAIPIARWVFILAISYILLYPLFYMISVAVKAPMDFVDTTVVWVPKNYSFHNITKAFKALDYMTTFGNTVKVGIVSALIEVVTCSVTAYGLARFEFKEKKVLMFLLILTILVPLPMIITPLAVRMRYLDFFGILGFIGDLIGTDIRPNLLNSPWAFYIPSIFSVGLKAGLFTYMYIQFFKGLPKELEEAASIDGAGPLKTFTTIVVPSSGTIFLTVTIFSIIWHWNDTFLSTMFLSKDYPLSVALSRIGSKNIGDMYDPKTTGIVFAGCLLVILPMLILYCILQRQFIKSIDRVGIVG